MKRDTFEEKLRKSFKDMIEINNLTTVSIDETFLKKVAQKVLDGEKKKDSDLSIALVGQGRIRALNKKYRGKNRVTDVLAFPETKILWGRFKVGPNEKISGLGEIVICLREVRKNAKRFSSSFEKELTRVLIHGILHLLGYDHERSEKEEKRMREKEDYYLSEIFQREAGFIVLLLDILFVVLAIGILIFYLLEDKNIISAIRSVLIKIKR